MAGGKFSAEEREAIRKREDPNCKCGAPKHDHGYHTIKGGGYGPYVGDDKIDCPGFVDGENETA